MKRNILSKVSIVLLAIIVMLSESLVTIVNAMESSDANEKAVADNTLSKYDIVEKFYNSDNQLIEIFGSVTTDSNDIYVYVDGLLTQKVHSDLKTDMLVYEKVDNNTRVAYNRASDNIEIYKITDFVKKVESQDNENSEIETYGLDGWTLYNVYAPNPILTGSKTCELYFMNYDEEPDSHLYSGTQAKFSKGTAIGIVVSVLATFIQGSVTVSGIVVALGSAIVSDFLAKKADGIVYFSTQKIKYAPIINGQYVWYDAYITKRWVIIDNSITGARTIKLDNESYASNKGQTPGQIAFNAQEATMS